MATLYYTWPELARRLRCTKAELRAWGRVGLLEVARATCNVPTGKARRFVPRRRYACDDPTPERGRELRAAYEANLELSTVGGGAGLAGHLHRRVTDALATFYGNPTHTSVHDHIRLHLRDYPDVHVRVTTAPHDTIDVEVTAMRQDGVPLHARTRARPNPSMHTLYPAP